jgi:mannose-6-phosphate isomerase-like protein (cupin superfamily)
VQPVPAGSLAHGALCDHRLWRGFETLAASDQFQVKRIGVNPGAARSLQSHVHRAEHWIVVAYLGEDDITRCQDTNARDD